MYVRIIRDFTPQWIIFNRFFLYKQINFYFQLLFIYSLLFLLSHLPIRMNLKASFRPRQISLDSVPLFNFNLFDKLNFLGISHKNTWNWWIGGTTQEIWEKFNRKLFKLQFAFFPLHFFCRKPYFHWILETLAKHSHNSLWICIPVFPKNSITSFYLWVCFNERQEFAYIRALSAWNDEKISHLLHNFFPKLL